ncbi:serine/threonine-protein kinase [Rhodococcus sp. NBC_00294]|uniref:serine/threonine-protein kinase n=1 Tax=Rhodococcus sp. NBC_00294 TaxID=2976004 RepID=UPI002E288E80|nr:serine/threonine-protein kinase [Rhodococcus sp. NBC_00294]
MVLRPGSEFAGFRVERLLGHGGTAEVYLARRGSAPPETLKILRADAPRDAFAAEVRIGALLQHPNIVAAHDHGEFRGRPWMSMSHVDGYSAARLVARGQIPLDVHRAARIVDGVARALDHAHGLGIVHRDVKPANILLASVADADTREQILLSDWGIARLTTSPTPLVSDDGTVLTSIGYAAPELLRGGTLTARTDIYALGATLVELLTGRPPFPLATPFAVMDAQLRRTPPSVSSRRADLPTRLDAVVQRALAKEPPDRFASCHDLSVAVARALRDHTPPEPGRPPASPPPEPGRPPASPPPVPGRPWYRRR